MYDPVIGRFPSLDPKADAFVWVSPYNYAENSPIANIDLWGLQKYYAADGNLLGQVGTSTDVRVVNQSLSNQQATTLIGNSATPLQTAPQAYQQLSNNSTAFADYFTPVADVTNDAALQTYTANGSNCFSAAEAQLADAGVSQTGPNNAINTLVDNSADLGLTADPHGGAIRIQTELNNGNPVMVGVQQTKSNGTVSNAGNANSTTGHFVVIRSASVSSDGTVTFNYLDNASSASGKSSNNNFNLNTSTGTITDETVPARSSITNYVVSEVRKNR